MSRINQIIQSSASASGAGDVLLTTIPTQQLGFGNIQFNDSGLSEEQQLCAAACDKPLPKHQEEIVECLKSCGVSQIWEQETAGRAPENAVGVHYDPYSSMMGQMAASGRYGGQYSSGRETYNEGDVATAAAPAAQTNANDGSGKDASSQCKSLMCDKTKKWLLIGGGILAAYFILKSMRK